MGYALIFKRRRLGGVLSAVEEAAFRAMAPNHAKWLVDPIVASSAKFGLSPFIMLAIARQESNFGKALTLADGRKGVEGPESVSGTGDFAARPNVTYGPPPNGRGFGHGVWQIDWGSHREFIESGRWADIWEATDYAAALLRSNLDALLKIGLSGDILTLAAVAAYNTGLGNVKKNLDNPDRTTTGGHYGSGILNQAVTFFDAFRRALAGS